MAAVSQIVEIEPAPGVIARIKQWEGNYSAYATQKELALVRQQQEYAAQQKEIERLKEDLAAARLKTLVSEAETIDGLRVIVQKMGNADIDELLKADEIFLTGSAAEITPVREIAGLQFKPASMTEMLLNDFAALTRRKNAA